VSEQELTEDAVRKHLINVALQRVGRFGSLDDALDDVMLEYSTMDHPARPLILSTISNMQRERSPMPSLPSLPSMPSLPPEMQKIPGDIKSKLSDMFQGPRQALQSVDQGADDLMFQMQNAVDARDIPGPVSLPQALLYRADTEVQSAKKKAGKKLKSLLKELK
jgi:hypothetical protein